MRKSISDLDGIAGRVGVGTTNAAAGIGELMSRQALNSLGTTPFHVLSFRAGREDTGDAPITPVVGSGLARPALCPSLPSLSNRGGEAAEVL
jgi:hypothetical protein